ncbi:glucuronate isomerase [Aquiflexum lacus]|uniref:glucuronate isomerase n=1 Tax=Aquiflexum lacus TaxID=2483805 RepID=UPI0018946250|nr:glucuronate isomerase [Aquiflexum lacus]
MDSFTNKNWLIKNKTGERLYHEVAAQLPIIDYHNHLNPQHIAEDKKFSNLTELWIAHDPYKHRAMRINGIPENGITGSVSAFEKYQNWVNTISKTLGNPLFHWSFLELKRIFDIDEMLNQDNAKAIWETCNHKLQQEEFKTCSLIQKWKAEILITSDDLLDNLDSHKKIAFSQNSVKVLPSLRADSILDFGNPKYLDWIQKLELEINGIISNLSDFKEAIKKRLDFFAENGCLFADHALDSGFSFKPIDEQEATAIFKKVIQNQPLEPRAFVRLYSFMLNYLGDEYGRRGWIMQLHIGAQRNTSSRLRKLVGPAGGFASIGKACEINSLTLFLDSLDKAGVLPETILYTLNPADNAALASLTGSFTEDGLVGKIQFGPAWWYNDHYAGIRKHLNDISSYGLLSTFIGMTTDSRSILSLSRHEYFRRILCDQIGGWTEEGKLPKDMALLEQLIKDISYFNIKNKILKREKIWQE